MTARWYRNAVVYSVDVRSFQDSDGDGVGDFQGLISRLDHLERLGVTTLWLNPIQPSPDRDGGYDITDFYTVDPRFGTLGDFTDFMDQCQQRGLRVVLDLVINHTSDEHPWFQQSRDPNSPYRDWYLWSADEPAARDQGMVFPGAQKETWTYDREAGGYYYHRFYDFEPDLNVFHPPVRAELLRIVGFWARMGVSGFRIDAVPFVVERTTPDAAQGSHDYAFYSEVRDRVSWNHGDFLLLGEANVPLEEQLEVFGEGARDGDGDADRVQMLFAFDLNAALMLALARGDSAPVQKVLSTLPALPRHGQWATFLRNHDEVDLSQLSEQERSDVFAAFGPDDDMQLYGRGIRRRLAPMLRGDLRRLKMAYSLQFTLPGTPVLRYGDEIGMGEDLSLDQREAIRTPMQWTHESNGSFSTAERARMPRPVIVDGDFGIAAVNVRDQRRDVDSLLSWFERMLRTLRECDEVGTGQHQHIATDGPGVLVHRAENDSGAMLFVHNLRDEPATVDVRSETAGVLVGDGTPYEVFADGVYDGVDLAKLRVDAYGYRWLRLR